MIKKIGVSLSVFGAVLVFGVSSVSAFDPFGGNLCNGDGRNPTNQSSTCVDSAVSGRTKTNPISGSNGLLPRAVGILSAVTGLVAVIMLVVGSIQYIMSGGDANKTKSAKHTIVNALTGLLIIGLASAIIFYVIYKVVPS